MQKVNAEEWTKDLTAGSGVAQSFVVKADEGIDGRASFESEE